MATKEKKSVTELAALIMQEIRKSPDCVDIKNVAIIRPAQTAVRDPSWGFAWTRDYSSNLPPAVADGIAQKLQGQFDLA